MDKERVPCAPVLTVNEAMAHPHLNERKTVRWVDDPLLGKVAIPGVPVKFSAWPDRTELRSARLGEDNERVLRDYLGFPTRAFANCMKTARWCATRPRKPQASQKLGEGPPSARPFTLLLRR